ncbi:MAG: exodeoxyribonuclease VII large subunit [Pseudomonadota bacterium]|nr:exodeoxyribonuclease VII large subunit [Pseudomonadota bacterium]
MWLADDPSGIQERYESVTLSAFLGKIAGLIRESTRPEWVRVEISRIQERNHIFLELVEHDTGGREIAKCSARIWQSRKHLIYSKFQAGTGAVIEAGIRVMILVEASFHPQYGFALTVIDIDPAYTLGDMERKLTEIRMRLRKEGIYEANHRFTSPIDFTKVAVLSPENAAGLGDFKVQANWLEADNLCQFDYYTAVFQGISAPDSIYVQLQDIARIQTMALDGGYDALVILRGGGAVTDLAWLNDYYLARAICKMELPVFTGIGHQQDNTILDEVAHTRFDTPSKVIGHILDRVKDSAISAKYDWEEISTFSKRSLSEAKNRLHAARDWLTSRMHGHEFAAHLSIDSDISIIKSRAHNNIANTKTAIGTFASEVQIGAENRIHFSRSESLNLYKETISLTKGLIRSLVQEMDTYKLILVNTAQHSVEMASSNTSILLTIITQQSRNDLASMRRAIGYQIEHILSFSPQEILKRGYVMVFDGENVISRAKEAWQHEVLTLEFSDGRIKTLPVKEMDNE